MNFQQAIQILAHLTPGERDDAAGRVARDLTTKGDADGLMMWVYNGDYSGSETVASMQAEFDENAVEDTDEDEFARLTSRQRTRDSGDNWK